MTQLLQDVMATIRRLPDQEQDALAVVMFAHLAATKMHVLPFDQELKAIEALRDGLDDGTTELVPDEEMEALRKSCGL